MVSVTPNPVPGFRLVDPIMKSGISSPPATASTAEKDPGDYLSSQEDSSVKTRKPYTMTKSRESWSEQEHDRFLEALQLFDRDWKKIEAFVGSKNVIQIRSHAQKYFLKVQKNGTGEHVPPPRPKRKATHPYPQKALKNASAASVELAKGNKRMPLQNRNSFAAVNTSPVVNGLVADDWYYSSSSNESVQKDTRFFDPNDQIENSRQIKVMPDFSQVYSFLGSIFDPNATDHLQRLKQMDPINLETVVLLMRNLSVNLNSSAFEEHQSKWLSYGSKAKGSNSGTEYGNVQNDELDREVTSA